MNIQGGALINRQCKREGGHTYLRCVKGKDDDEHGHRRDAWRVPQPAYSLEREGEDQTCSGGQIEPITKQGTCGVPPMIRAKSMCCNGSSYRAPDSTCPALSLYIGSNKYQEGNRQFYYCAVPPISENEKLLSAFGSQHRQGY